MPGKKGTFTKESSNNSTTVTSSKWLECMYLMGFSLSPRLIQKMQPQTKQPTHGNDFIASSIGPGYNQLYKSFHHFFACQDALTVPPPKDECPNFKVDEFFQWLWYVWKEAWIFGENFLVDKQTCKKRGKSEYKTQCGKFKQIGDGIQADCIADDGFTYDFFFCNEPVEKKLLPRGFCPMHCRILHMFANLKDSGHRCKMDNLFTLVNLACAAYNLDKKVLIHGVIQKSGVGFHRWCSKIKWRAREQMLFMVQWRLQSWEVTAVRQIWLLHHAMIKSHFIWFHIAYHKSLGLSAQNESGAIGWKRYLISSFSTGSFLMTTTLKWTIMTLQIDWD